MSLTSVELNYLVWRYLQESGLELSAYALQKELLCLDYEHLSNKLVPQILPGCLVSLVQKGILYTFLEEASEGKPPRFSIPDAVMKEKEEMKEERKGIEQKQEAEKPLQPAPDSDSMQVDFETRLLTASAVLPESLCLQWHPAQNVLVVGTDDSAAAIHAFGGAEIAETVRLLHPPAVLLETAVSSDVTCVSWAPLGSVVLTAGNDLRAWSPDGRLKNIVPASLEVPAPVVELHWNARGTLVLAVDSRGTLSVYDGVSLGLVLELREKGEVHACWISDHKFAVSNGKNQIQIFSVAGELVPAGQLRGHEHAISNLTFSPISKLLASSSDTDYVIKVWNSQLSHDALELNVIAERVPDVEYHTAPIVALRWLSRPGDLEGNHLLSVSMEGAVNVWDAFTGDALVSANVFKNPDNFRFSETISMATKNTLVYAAAVSPDTSYLAIGDDSGVVSIWDVQTKGQKSGLLRCLGVFSPKNSGDDFGICDLSWNQDGDLLCVSYKGGDSVLLKWAP